MGLLLSADVGGTHTRLALVDQGKIVTQHTFPSQEFESLEQVISHFLAIEGKAVSVAAIGIAGPVYNGICKTVNLPWIVDSKALSRDLKIPKVFLINDLEAHAHGSLILPATDFVSIQEGAPKSANRALLAAGTGLGIAGLFWDGAAYRPFATEGGHTDFSPTTCLEAELFLHLKKKYEHVSSERVLSGPGLYELYRFLIDTRKEVESPDVAEALQQHDPPLVISSWASKDPAASRAVDWFLSIYGSVAGNLCLQMLALGGIYIGGGIFASLVDRAKKGDFVKRFSQKGRMEGLLSQVPIYAILNPHTALLGAAHYGAVAAARI
jgi:glucokinase